MLKKNLVLIIVAALLLAAGSFAAITNFNAPEWKGYDTAWKSVDSLSALQLPESALKLVEEIYAHAKAEKNGPQVIKSTIYRASFTRILNENGSEKAIALIAEEIDKSAFPEKNILQSLAAEAYWQYYSDNQWRINQRTNLDANTSNDIATWDAKAFYNKSLSLYKSSIKDREALKKVSVKKYSEILYEGDAYGALLRPTLFDMLGHRTLNFFGDDNYYVSKSANAFIWDNPVLYESAKQFAGYAFTETDTTDNKILALHLLQDLTLAHLYDTYPDALVDITLTRYDIVNRKNIIANGDTLFLNALLRDEKQYANDSASARFTHRIAQWHTDRAVAFDRMEGVTYKWEYKTALEYIDKALAKYPNSMGGLQCAALKKVILTPYLGNNVERVNAADKPFRMMIQYRNTDTAWCSVYAATPDEIDKINQMPNDARMAELTKLKLVREWPQVLPAAEDHNMHFAEAKVDALPFGSYMIAIGSEKTPSSTAIFSITDCWISNLSFMAVSGSEYATDNSKRFYVTDRISGAPLKGVSVQTFRKEFDYGKQKYERKELQSYITDANGMFEVRDPLIRDYYSFGFRLKNGKDQLESSGDYYVAKSYSDNYKPNKTTMFFTDRNMYRPGQTIYFKGIVYENSDYGKSKNVVPNFKTTVKFYDANYQVIAQQDLVTNDFGSFNGTFTAPLGALTGWMRINNESGSTEFRVEEYKRPTFEVTVDPLKGNYAVNDSVIAQGKATAYSGAVIDHAKVQYRIVRNTYYPYPYYFRFGKIAPNYGATEIAHGEVETDDDGNFKIPFVALPDPTSEKVNLPTFTYTVSVDVTDVSGETRSASGAMTLGYHSLALSATLGTKYVQSKDPWIHIETKNLNGEQLNAEGSVTIYPLTATQTLYRDRYWEAPDQFTMSEKDFHTSFPNDQYKQENNAALWKEGPSAANLRWNTALRDSIQMPFKSLKRGMYRVVFESKDKQGNVIRAFYDVAITDSEMSPAVPTYMYTENTYLIQPAGGNAVLSVGSSASNVHALVAIRKKSGITYQWMDLKQQAGKGGGGSLVVEIPVTEDDRGGIAAQISYIRDGRYFTASYYISVPYDNKELKVEVETHRDKLQPGAQETWKVRISGNGGEAVAAELLASMYDKSLDALSYALTWPDVYWPDNSISLSITSGGFENAYSNHWSGDSVYTAIDVRFPMYYDINWFGFIYQYNGRFDALTTTISSMSVGTYGFSGEGVELKEVAIMDSRNRSPLFNKGKSADPLWVANPLISANDELYKSNELINRDEEESNAIVLPNINLGNVAVRTNFNETAFFYPQLQTDSTGAVVFNFTMPEALTAWKFMAFAHTKEMQTGSAFDEVVTQKELMIQPNMPRFLREGDRIILTAKISNLTDKEIAGSAQLELFNATNMQSLNAAFGNVTPTVQFKAPDNGSSSVSWEVIVPEGIDAIVYRVKASNGTFSDGEENGLPVLSNRMLVTESLPLWVRGSGAKSFSFDKLLNSNKSATLRHQSVTLEYASNPAWYAVQALPYLMEYPYECSEQLFSRYYANTIATGIVNSDPEIRRVYDSWKTNPASLTSNLEKNQELKSLLLQETPWVLQAQNETENKKRVAMLFDQNRMQSEQQSALNKLKKQQKGDGGWPWFKGDESSVYITQYIVTGFAHLQQLNVLSAKDQSDVDDMLRKAMPFCSNAMLTAYENLDRWKIDKATYTPDNTILQYLYASSYYDESKYPLTGKQKEAKQYFLGQAEKYWTSYGLYQKGMIALILSRYEKTKTAAQIVKSLTENSMRSEEMGMYWKSNVSGYYWYEAPIETQALMIEVYDEVAQDKNAVDALQVWLLRQKQTTDWKTTRATAEACYALLMRGRNLLSNKELAVITAGGTLVVPDKIEMGTGYFKTNWLGSRIVPELGNISITAPADNLLSYGAMYWQYFEDLDKITMAKTNLQLDKQLYLQVNTDKGPELTPITDKTELHVGDLVKVRIELRSDRDLEYVHLKDMRASAFEPVNVLSQYKWQDGLGYYEATGDASTNFFISYLSKGTYVFEYPVRVAQKGYFSNGVATIQCMYAPEFSSHSAGVMVLVK